MKYRTSWPSLVTSHAVSPIRPSRETKRNFHRGIGQIESDSESPCPGHCTRRMFDSSARHREFTSVAGDSLFLNRPRTSGQNSFQRFPTKRPRKPLLIRRTLCAPVVELGGSQAFATRLLPTAPT